MPEGLYHRQLLAGQEPDQRAAAGADVAHLVRQAVFFRSGDAVAAAQDRVSLRVCQRLPDRPGPRLAGFLLKYAHGAVDEHGFRVQDGLPVDPGGPKSSLYKVSPVTVSVAEVTSLLSAVTVLISS